MAHRWKFARVGGFDQVQLRTGKDLVSIGELDQKLWVALACPIKGLELDERTLALIDTDKDGRVRASELIAATKWIAPLLKDVEVLAKGSASLALSAIDEANDEGKLLLKSAKKILASLGKADAKEISVADMKDAIGAFEKDKLNGDGVVPVDTAEDAALKKVIEDVLACAATKPKDKSGKDGVDEAAAKAFFEAVRAHAEWLKKGKTDDTLRPCGDDTAAAHAAYAAVKAKIDDYFARARVAAYDARALAAVNGEEKAYLEIAAKDLNVTASEVSHFPIAQVAVDRPLPLGPRSAGGGVNPAWADKVSAFVSAAVKPLLGDKSALTEAEWKTISGKLDPYGAYVADKKGASVEKLGAARVEELAAGELDKKLLALIADDKALEPEAQAIEKVEKLVRYNRDLMEIANNFVSFRDFYSRKKPAAFQIGTLYLDTRACELCIEVNDAGRHATMAPLANTYLVYCDLKNSKGQTKQIAAAMTAGDVDNLMVGRNGIFYDRKGVDWDATITKIIDNPISVRQAFWSPYKKALRMVEEFVASRAAAAQADADAKLTADVNAATASTTAPAPAPGAPATPPATQTRPLDIGVVAALGVAVGGITAALGAFLEAFFGLGMWMPLGVLGLILAISGPSMAVAWLKLRKRNLGPILDANGWALNAMATVNVPLGGSLTKEAKLPEDSERDLSDPFAEQPRPWGFYVFLLVLLGLAIGWYVGKLDHYLPVSARSVTVLGENAPAYVAPAADAAPSAAAPAEAAPAEAAPAPAP
ncbi:MAG: hypothetical protein K1X94_23565 [Sandaracinaceae bacterium]|nr:hypothetical protein [Sandaracinaceae bacterium]